MLRLYPCWESNPNLRFRKPSFYPLNYKGASFWFGKSKFFSANGQIFRERTCGLALIKQRLEDGKGFDFLKAGDVKPVIFKDTFDDTHPVVPRESVERHILIAHLQEADQHTRLVGTEVMRMRRHLVRENSIQHIEIKSFAPVFRIGVNP